MKKPKPGKAAAKKKSAGKKPAATKAIKRAWDEDGRLTSRLEAQLFHAEDRDEGEDDDGEVVSERTVSAALDPDGTLIVSSFERDLSTRIHGDGDEEEFRLSIAVPPHAVARLAYELVREKFGGEWSGEKDFAAFCADHDIPVDEDES